jgi:hypothetical protein
VQESALSQSSSTVTVGSPLSRASIPLSSQGVVATSSSASLPARRHPAQHSHSALPYYSNTRSQPLPPYSPLTQTPPSSHHYGPTGPNYPQFPTSPTGQHSHYTLPPQQDQYMGPHHQESYPQGLLSHTQLQLQLQMLQQHLAPGGDPAWGAAPGTTSWEQGRDQNFVASSGALPFQAQMNVRGGYPGQSTRGVGYDLSSAEIPNRMADPQLLTSSMAQILHTAHQLSMGLPPFNLPTGADLGNSTSNQQQQQYLAFLAQAQHNARSSPSQSQRHHGAQQTHIAQHHSRSPTVAHGSSTTPQTPRRAASTSGPNAGAAPMMRDFSETTTSSRSCTPKTKTTQGYVSSTPVSP